MDRRCRARVAPHTDVWRCGAISPGRSRRLPTFFVTFHRPPGSDVRRRLDLTAGELRPYERLWKQTVPLDDDEAHDRMD